MAAGAGGGRVRGHPGRLPKGAYSASPARTRSRPRQRARAHPTPSLCPPVLTPAGSSCLPSVARAPWQGTAALGLLYPLFPSDPGKPKKEVAPHLRPPPGSPVWVFNTVIIHGLMDSIEVPNSSRPGKVGRDEGKMH